VQWIAVQSFAGRDAAICAAASLTLQDIHARALRSTSWLSRGKQHVGSTRRND
jgi:hypothetical protein